MLKKEDLLSRPNYILTKYQNEIFRQLHEYMKANNLKKKDIAKKLQVSNAYVSQILNGEFNFTLKKLIEIGIVIGKVPVLDFVSPEKYWLYKDQKNNKMDAIVQYNYFNLSSDLVISHSNKIKMPIEETVIVSNMESIEFEVYQN